MTIEFNTSSEEAQKGPRFRKTLAGMSYYVPGRPSFLRSPKQFVQLASNELAYGPLPSVVAAIQDALGEINRYPDMYGSEVVDAIAERHSVTPTQIGLGCGSIEVLRQAAMVTLEAGDDLICAKPSFPEYSILASLLGVNCIQIPLSSKGSHDLEAMLDALRKQTRLLIICTPNNPTSSVTNLSETRWLLDTISHEILVVIDEAYQEFTDDREDGSAINLVGSYPNLLVLRTFSKAFGLAGLRIGYGVGSSELVKNLGLAKIPFSVSSVAQVAALASLSAIKEMEERVAKVIAERERMMQILVANEIPVCSRPQGNFLWFPNPPGGASRLVEDAMSRGVLVRGIGEEGVRITIGEREDNDCILDLILAYTLSGDNGQQRGAGIGGNE